MTHAKSVNFISRQGTIKAFLKAVKGHGYEFLFLTALFTGIREGEALGLQWPAVNLSRGTININSQLQKIVGKKEYQLITPKNGKGRCITPVPFVIDTLRCVKQQQLDNKSRCGECWENSGFVFTNELGQHLTPKPIYDSYKKVVAEIGIPNARFHDLRHSYAVASIRAGDDIKTVQENLGHELQHSH